MPGNISCDVQTRVALEPCNLYALRLILLMHHMSKICLASFFSSEDLNCTF